jgi:acyl-CoA synthetase (AMP-forming)/AMP-acid ligase II
LGEEKIVTMANYMNGPGWTELATEPVFGRPTKVWRERPKQVLDLLTLATAPAELPFLVQGSRRITFGAFRNALDPAAAELARLGVRAKDHVLIVLYNSPDFLLAQWAAWRIGAVPVLGNRWWSERELVEVIGRVNPALIITDMAVPENVASRTKVISPKVVATWWDLPRPASPPAPARFDDIREDDVALMVFTAGSTGVPKGVQQSHRGLCATQQTLHAMRGSRPPLPASEAQQKVTLMTTPMFHNGGVVSGLSSLIDGNRIAMLQGRFVPEEVMDVIQRERVTSWQAVPTMFSRVLDHPKFASYDLTSLVAPSSGGAVVTSELANEVRGKLPHAAKTFAVGYGMTELSYMTMALASQLDQKPGTVGKTIPGVELRIDNPDETGEGEICGRAAITMVGYFGGEEEQPIDAAGWLHTGDLGRIDADGYLYVTGRLKDMVIRGGENIACPNVEQALLLHPNVLEVAVVGYPHKELGEEVAAIVYARPGSNVSETELRDFAKSHLAYFEVPSRWFFRKEPMPVLPTGKIDKRSLRKELVEGAPSRG